VGACLLRIAAPAMSASENSRDARSRLVWPTAPLRHLWSHDHEPPTFSYPLNTEGRMEVIIEFDWGIVRKRFGNPIQPHLAAVYTQPRGLWVNEIGIALRTEDEFSWRLHLLWSCKGMIMNRCCVSSSARKAHTGGAWFAQFSSNPLQNDLKKLGVEDLNLDLEK
jgi:hypothetical protein